MAIHRSASARPNANRTLDGTTLDGAIALVTGATGGIGAVTALELARLGARVVVAGRDRTRCEAAVEAIGRATGNRAIEYLVADLSVMAEVRRAAAEVRSRTDRLSILVNNAGGIYGARTETGDGFEYTFALDHLSYFLLTNLLLDLLRSSAPARVVNVSSGIHKAGRLNFDDLQLRRGYSAFRAYGQAKLANVMFTYELSRRLDGTGVTVNAMSPGMTATNFGRNNRGLFGLMTRMSNAVGGRTPERGAETVIWLAASPDVDGITGKYFEDRKPIPSGKRSYDSAAGRRLWEASARLVGIEP